MLAQCLVAAAVCICNIAIHALVMTALIAVVRAVGARAAAQSPAFLPGTMIAAVCVLMAAHAVEVLVWALAYGLVGAAPDGTDLVYFAFVNYTTLGYGDVVPLREWRLLGPITAMNGVLLFGWSTAVIFEVLRKAMARTGGPG